MRRSAVSELLEPSCRAAGLNFCVTLGGSETLQAVPPLSLLQNVKEHGASAPIYNTLSCIDFNASKTIQFLPGGEEIQREGPLAGRARLSDAITFSP